jgi:hypothetical protein
MPSLAVLDPPVPCADKIASTKFLIVAIFFQSTTLILSAFLLLQRHLICDPFFPIM